ncbi:MAG: heme-binding domain-containing protein [Chlorobi bacterium]|nr:heme-binding domain-containing protein [Chlorobiota bacterium]
MKKKIWFILIVIVVIIQFIPTGRPDAVNNNPNDVLINNPVPDSVASLLTTTCYDCHSNETYYPWYSYVAPVSWLVARDVKEGRKHVNFSEWESLDKMKKAEILDDLVDEVSDGGMPMLIYPLMHPEAKLTKADRQMIVDWAESFGESLFE